MLIHIWFVVIQKKNNKFKYLYTPPSAKRLLNPNLRFSTSDSLHPVSRYFLFAIKQTFETSNIDKEFILITSNSTMSGDL